MSVRRACKGRALPANVRVATGIHKGPIRAFIVIARGDFQQLPSGNIQSFGDPLQRIYLDIAAPALKRVDHLRRKADHQSKACLGKTHLLARTAEVVA